MDEYSQKIANIRGIYTKKSFDTGDAHENPLLQFQKWLDEAIDAKCDEPNAFVLSTVLQNKPRARVMLCKGIHEGKITFYTNYLSHKGEELSLNPFVSMTFLWLPLQRQIRIEGQISKVERELSDKYFALRPRGHQLGAIASSQSQIVRSQAQLEAMFSEVETAFVGIEKIPRPQHWGGYAVEPSYFEFWQGRENRMHDRIAYQNVNTSFIKQRLCP